MAYALRYFKELTHADGKVVRLEIHKKDSTADAIEIGAVVQGLSLQIQGQQGDIDTPIVKTSLSMTFVDAYDIENGQKNGFWEEFYTPDSVLWKVIIKAKDAQETAFRAIWGGYVTPDSFSENLTYRGSVNIIARDNLGHMQDFPFDAEGDADGMISLHDLVEAGWAKIESPMSLDWRGDADGAIWMESNGVLAYDTLMNVSAFKDMNWYEAIEKALYSYGAVMRYIGNNRIQLGSLRYMPYQGADSMSDLPSIEPIFLSGATRELVPAARRIEESVSYKFGGVASEELSQNDFEGGGYDSTADLPWYKVYPITNTTSGSGWANAGGANTLFFNPFFYDIHKDASGEVMSVEDKMLLAKEVYLCCNTDKSTSVEWSRNMALTDVDITIELGRKLRFKDKGFTLVPCGYLTKKMNYSIILEENGITHYLNADGEWQTNSVMLTEEQDGGISSFTVRVPLSEYSGYGLVKVVIYWIQSLTLFGSYVATRIKVEGGAVMLENNTVNSVYEDSNNVIISRDPELGPAYNTVALPSFIENGIFYRSGNYIYPASTWRWAYSGGTYLQMAVYNHLQLLSYYAKPNNLISGTIVNADVTRARAIYIWKGKEHILISGNYNLLTGRIDSAMLREFARYEDMWSESAGSELPATEEAVTGSGESGGSSSASTYTSTTTVNIGSGGGGGGGASYLNDLLDVNVEGVLAASVLYYNGTGWVARTTASLLSGLASEDYVDDKTSALDERVTANEDEIDNMSALREWYASVGVHLGKDDNGIYTDENFRSSKEISAGGIGAEGEGGGGGADSLDGLLDVTISDMSAMTDEEKDSQVLGYDNTSGQWVNKKTMYIHRQNDASDTWVITHNLGKMPNVKIVDTNKQLCFGDIYYTDSNTVTIKLGIAESGVAYLD